MDEIPMNHTTISDMYFMGKAVNSYKKAWISTYQEQVKRISGMNSWYEIMVFLWIHAFVYEFIFTKNR
jgi:hypothetical protein